MTIVTSRFCWLPGAAAVVFGGGTPVSFRRMIEALFCLPGGQDKEESRP